MKRLRPSPVFVVLTLVTAGVVTGAFVARPGRASGGGGGGFTNLKVLPKNTSTAALNRIMVDEFTDGLGVTCSFCHAVNKDTGRPDYASDEKPEKEIARSMMRMTLRINKRYFEVGHPAIGDPSLVIRCETCHRGSPRPDEATGADPGTGGPDHQ